MKDFVTLLACIWLGMKIGRTIDRRPTLVVGCS